MNIAARTQTVFVNADYLWDDNGRRYHDFKKGRAVNCLDHSPAIFVEPLGFWDGRPKRKKVAFLWGGLLENVAELASRVAVGHGAAEHRRRSDDGR